jgi:hypothetical protein
MTEVAIEALTVFITPRSAWYGVAKFFLRPHWPAASRPSGASCRCSETDGSVDAS